MFHAAMTGREAPFPQRTYSTQSWTQHLCPDAPPAAARRAAGSDRLNHRDDGICGPVHRERLRPLSGLEG